MQHSSIECLHFDEQGRPKEWALVTEMKSRRECAAVAFSLTRSIMAPVVQPAAVPAPAPGSVKDRAAAIEQAEQGMVEKSNPLAQDDLGDMEVEGVEQES